jgi:hypothetical protein
VNDQSASISTVEPQAFLDKIMKIRKQGYEVAWLNLESDTSQIQVSIVYRYSNLIGKRRI